MSNEHTEVTEATRRAEAEEARVRHGADRPATSTEDDAIDEHDVGEDVRTHYREMTDLGAHEVGEGRIP
jgi:hypothetical protein